MEGGSRWHGYRSKRTSIKGLCRGSSHCKNTRAAEDWNVQANFQIMRLSVSTRLTFLRRTLPPKITGRAVEGVDCPQEWALASMIAGEESAEVGLARPGEVASSIQPCKRQMNAVGTESAEQAGGSPSHPRGRGWTLKRRRYQVSELLGWDAKPSFRAKWWQPQPERT